MQNHAYTNALSVKKYIIIIVCENIIGFMFFDKNDDKHIYILHTYCVYIIFYVQFKCSLKFVRQVKKYMTSFTY